MSRITFKLSELLRSRLSGAAKATGFSDTDLAKALIRAGLDQMATGEGIVIRINPSKAKPLH